MKCSSKQRRGLMGNLHNNVVELIDQTQLTPPEVVIVLRLLADEIERLFILEVQDKRKK